MEAAIISFSFNYETLELDLKLQMQQSPQPTIEWNPDISFHFPPHSRDTFLREFLEKFRRKSSESSE